MDSPSRLRRPSQPNCEWFSATSRLRSTRLNGWQRGPANSRRCRASTGKVWRSRSLQRSECSKDTRSSQPRYAVAFTNWDSMQRSALRPHRSQRACSREPRPKDSRCEAAWNCTRSANALRACHSSSWIGRMKPSHGLRISECCAFVTSSSSRPKASRGVSVPRSRFLSAGS